MYQSGNKVSHTKRIYMNTQQTQTNMGVIFSEISSLSDSAKSFLSQHLNGFTFDEDGELVEQVHRTRTTVVRPTQADRDIMMFLQTVNTGMSSTIIQNHTSLTKKEVSSSLSYLKDIGFISSEGKGPSTVYVAETNSLNFPEQAPPKSRRKGHHVGPTARAAFIEALMELNPGDQFKLSDIRKRAIAMFPESNFQVSSFGAVPSTLEKEGHISGDGQGKSRVFTLLSSQIPGGLTGYTEQDMADSDTMEMEDQEALVSGMAE